MKIFFILLFLGSVIVLSSYLAGHYFGIESKITWRISNTLHFLGGVYAFFFVGSFFNITKRHHNTVATPLVKSVIFVFGALFLGVLWEWYELFFIYWDKVFELLESNLVYIDTMSDLALDLFGALLAGFYYVVVKNGKNK